MCQTHVWHARETIVQNNALVSNKIVMQEYDIERG